MRSIPPDHRLDASGVRSPNQLLAGAARGASDGWLALLTGCGLVFAAALFVMWPDWWQFALPALSLAALGGWGILDRVASEMRGAGESSPMIDGLLDGARAFLVLAGWGCAIAFVAFVAWHPMSGVIH